MPTSLRALTMVALNRYAILLLQRRTKKEKITSANFCISKLSENIKKAKHYRNKPELDS